MGFFHTIFLSETIHLYGVKESEEFLKILDGFWPV